MTDTLGGGETAFTSSLRHRLSISVRSSKLGRLVNRYYRWFAVAIFVLLVILVILAIVAAFVPWPAFLPDGRGLTGTLDRSLIVPLVLALAAYFYFYFLTAYRAMRKLLLVAQRTPEKMFPHSPEAGSPKQIFGRDQLVEEIVNVVRSPDTDPQIVVGGTGSGKTTLLFKLASRLADEYSVVPIVLSLQDKGNDLGDKSFTELAVNRFEQLVDPYVKTEAEADKLWRWMRKRGRIVVLADDLDRSDELDRGARKNRNDGYRARIRRAFDEARRRNLPLVVTTRPSGLPSGLNELPIDLSDPDSTLKGKDDAAKYVLKRAGKHKNARADEFEKHVKQNIKQGELLENAFYLSLLASLLRAEALEMPAPGNKYAVRLALLKADRRRVRGDKALDEDEWRQRREALRGIEDLAAAWLVPRDDRSLERWEENAVSDGERFGLLSLDDQGCPQFKHEVLHAYYASRAIVRGKEWRSKLEQKPNGARVRLALVLAAAARGENSGDFCHQACDLLLEDVDGLSPDQRLLRAAGAAELAKAGLFSERNREIAEGCLSAKANAGSVAKRAALKQLEALGGKRAVKVLWEYAQDDDYGTRWAAVECLIRRCSERTDSGNEAYDVIERKIEEALAGGRRLLEIRKDKGADDWDRRVILLKQAAWMLPSLRTSARDRGRRKRIDGYLQELLRLEREGVTCQRGLEASIAQGFKADAWRHPKEPPDRDAEEMLRERAVFWYSQLNLVHALALRMARGPTSHPGSLHSILTTRTRQGKNGIRALHPMLRDAAKLCRKELKGKPGRKRLRKMKLVVWKDEGVVVSRRPQNLDRRAAQLVGEITVLLNLHETGDGTQRGKFGEEVTLPRCLQRDRRWRELQDGCHKSCRFDLCPFQPARDRPSAHRELSRAFCRDQYRHARFWTASHWPPYVVSRVPPELWQWLEARARF